MHAGTDIVLIAPDESTTSSPEPVQFCRESGRRSKYARRVQNIRFWWWTGLSFLSLLFGTRLLGFGRTAGSLVAIGVMLGGLLVGALRVLRLRRILGDAPEDSLRKRLACAAPAAWITRHGEFADVAFEPMIYRAAFVDRMPKSVFWVALSASVGAILVIEVLGRLFGFWAAFDDLLVFKTFGGWAVGCLTADWLHPTYLRVVPGRVDVMRFSPFRTRNSVVARHDLRQAHLIIDLQNYVVFVDTERGTHELAIAFVRDSTRLAYHLLLAAMSSHPPPPLPDDALLG